MKGSLRLLGNGTDLKHINPRAHEIESRVSRESRNVNNCKFIFTSETEVGLRLEKEHVSSLGVLWDIFSVLITIVSKRLTRKERANIQHLLGRI